MFKVVGEPHCLRARHACRRSAQSKLTRLSGIYPDHEPLFRRNIVVFPRLGPLREEVTATESLREHRKVDDARVHAVQGRQEQSITVDKN